MAIHDDIRIINDGLAWLKANKPEQYEQAFFQMLDGAAGFAASSRP